MFLLIIIILTYYSWNIRRTGGGSQEPVATQAVDSQANSGRQPQQVGRASSGRLLSFQIFLDVDAVDLVSILFLVPGR